MKKIVIVYTLTLYFLYSYSLSPKEITKMISKIKEERVGISITKLDTTSNPFIIVQAKKEENLTKGAKKVPHIYIPPVIVEPTYRLDAILNHAVFINKKWYKKGSKIGEYRVIYIGKKSVVLKSPEKKKKTLYLKKKKYIKLH